MPQDEEKAEPFYLGAYPTLCTNDKQKQSGPRKGIL